MTNQRSEHYKPGMHCYKDAVTDEIKPLPVAYMESHRFFGCTQYCIPAEPKPDHEYERCWVCQRLLMPEPFDSAVEEPRLLPERFCSDTCSIAYREWYRKKWKKEHPE